MCAFKEKCHSKAGSADEYYFEDNFITISVGYCA